MDQPGDLLLVRRMCKPPHCGDDFQTQIHNFFGGKRLCCTLTEVQGVPQLGAWMSCHHWENNGFQITTATTGECRAAAQLNRIVDILKKNKVHVLEWLSKSCDPKRIQMLWHDLRQTVQDVPEILMNSNLFCREKSSKTLPRFSANIYRRHLMLWLMLMKEVLRVI